jgi:hypothetical protein
MKKPQNFEVFLGKDLILTMKTRIDTNDKICHGVLSTAALCTKNGVIYSDKLEEIMKLNFRQGVRKPIINSIIEIKAHYKVASSDGLDIFDHTGEHKYRIHYSHFTTVAMDTNDSMITAVAVEDNEAWIVQFQEKNKQWLEQSSNKLDINVEEDLTSSKFFLKNNMIYAATSNKCGADGQFIEVLEEYEDICRCL